MARPVAHRAQEPDKGNAAEGREKPDTTEYRWRANNADVAHEEGVHGNEKGRGNGKRQPRRDEWRGRFRKPPPEKRRISPPRVARGASQWRGGGWGSRAERRTWEA